MKIKDLQCSTFLGVFDWELEHKRAVILNIEMRVNTPKAAGSDSLSDAVDYALVEERVVHRLETSRYHLLERMVSELAEFILTLDGCIESVTVEADKPGALRHARSVSVSCTRERE